MRKNSDGEEDAQENAQHRNSDFFTGNRLFYPIYLQQFYANRN